MRITSIAVVLLLAGCSLGKPCLDEPAPSPTCAQANQSISPTIGRYQTGVAGSSKVSSSKRRTSSTQQHSSSEESSSEESSSDSTHAAEVEHAEVQTTTVKRTVVSRKRLLSKKSSQSSYSTNVQGVVAPIMTKPNIGASSYSSQSKVNTAESSSASTSQESSKSGYIKSAVVNPAYGGTYADTGFSSQYKTGSSSQASRSLSQESSSKGYTAASTASGLPKKAKFKYIAKNPVS